MAGPASFVRTRAREAKTGYRHRPVYRRPGRGCSRTQRNGSSRGGQVDPVEQGFAKADVIVESEYRTPVQEHAYLQPEAGLAYIDEAGRITVVCGGHVGEHGRNIWRRAAYHDAGCRPGG